MCRTNGRRCKQSEFQVTRHKLKQQIQYTKQQLLKADGESKKKYETRLKAKTKHYEDFVKEHSSSEETNSHPLACEPSNPIKFGYIRNPVSSTTYQTNHYFGQDIEPAGKYMTISDGTHLPEGWEKGEQEFQKPLHIEFGGNYTDEDNWKQRLSKHYGNKKGKALSNALKKDGYDGIITHDGRFTSETIAL